MDEVKQEEKEQKPSYAPIRPTPDTDVVDISDDKD